jgi:hypothetical protein
VEIYCGDFAGYVNTLPSWMKPIVHSTLFVEVGRSETLSTASPRAYFTAQGSDGAAPKLHLQRLSI